ncbi:MAG: Asp-tRNA(Asn)/Glu-tRNA(Gln) amidotransferase subunit GatA [Bacteroidetes bacterium]|nr:Asp-tRNA(Asn)/Glu-tRNA(Gln) amidotransferase subunit GatA [Bacteroidota bacterium]
MKNYETLAEIQQELSTGSIQCKDLVDFYLKRIHSAQNLNLFLEVYEEEARLRAAEIDQKISQGTQGKLAGLVLGVKDVICYQGHGLTAGSKILAGFESMFTATALQRLLDEDAIVIGRQNCDEFAMGSSNENSAYGPARNPVDPERVPGGSSGASAASVKAGLCHAALGSDTGGSVRQPSGFCGTIGFKPTYGRVSRWGLIAYASSFDQIGPITRSVEDTARIMEIMAGPDQLDNTAAVEEVPAYSQALKEDSGKTYTIAYIREALESPGLDPEIKQATQDLIQRFKDEGHTVKMVDFPYLDYVVPCYYVLTTAEASSNLSRYDGVHYGYRSPKAQTLEEVYTMSRSEGFGEEVKRRIMLGTFVLSAGYYDAYYTKAMKVRSLIQQETLEILQDCDFILTPTAPTPAFKLGEKANDPIEMFLSDIYTVHANLAGVPAISLPLGEHSSGLPFGIQLMGRAFDEENLLNFSSQIVKK